MKLLIQVGLVASLYTMGLEIESLGVLESGFIKDSKCTKDTPIIYGNKDLSIYGTGKRIKPRVGGRTDSEHKKYILQNYYHLKSMT